MNIYRSIEKRERKNKQKIKTRYFCKIRSGKKLTYFYHISFLPLYLKRLFWLLLALLSFKPGTYKQIFRFFKQKHLFARYHPPVKQRNLFKTLFFQLFGYDSFYVSNLYPAFKTSYILKNKKISFHRNEDPIVSIIIPVFNQLSYTYNCLLSIRERVSDKVPYEVIVVDDHSDDTTEAFFLNNVKGVIYIRNSENIGYLRSNNKAVNHASGTFICLLNNDTEVQEEWLESMLELIKQDNRIGCVGSKLIYPNNLLQEAGNVVFRDGNAAHFGWLANPDDCRCNFIREVDYCSAASILIRKTDFLTLGKFDIRYSPAYYEDTDLCFAVRNILNKRVMYQPLSKVIHYEGITSGKDVKKGSVKYFQEINYHKFKEKWAKLLKQHSPPGYNRSYRRLLPESAILILDWHLPSPKEDSGSLRLCRLIDIFKSLNYHVIFIPENKDKQEPYYTDLIRMGVEVRYDLYSDNAVNDFEVSDYFLSVKYIWISRPTVNQLYKDKISAFKHAKWIYDTVDLHHVRLHRNAVLHNDQNQLKLAEQMKTLEVSLAKDADVTITLTDTEKKLLEQHKAKKVSVIPNVHIPSHSEHVKAFSKRTGILFIGNYEHPPNVDAVNWLITEIMPSVNRILPETPIYLLGNKPPEELLRFANEQVIIPGFIEDVSTFFKNSRVFVAPLRYGAGMKGKIGQALEYSLPTITTSIGAEGMGLEHQKHVLIADDPVDFANHITRLYQDQELWENISANATEALSSFTPDVVRTNIKHLFHQLESDSGSKSSSLKSNRNGNSKKIISTM